jgi:hypothetical protein
LCAPQGGHTYTPEALPNEVNYFSPHPDAAGSESGQPHAAVQGEGRGVYNTNSSGAIAIPWLKQAHLRIA